MRAATTSLSGRDAHGALSTLRRGLRLSPELRRGLGLTLTLAVAATLGRVIAPVAVQLTIDRALLAHGGVDFGLVVTFAATGLGLMLCTSAGAGVMQYRLSRAAETALSALRVRAFRHIHDMSALHNSAEHRGALVSRVTADVNAISQFMEWGGVVLLVALLQLVLATIVMALYSPLLTGVVLATFVPLLALMRWIQSRLRRAYDQVRVRLGFLLSVLAESVVGAPVIRAYGATARTDERIAGAVDRHFRAAFRAGRTAAAMFSGGEVFAAVATSAVVGVGVWTGVGGSLSAGRLVAFLFLVSLFVGPVQVATEVLDMAQSAIAGWRRVLDLLDTPTDVRDPALDGTASPVPAGPIEIRFSHVTFAYPSVPGRAVLRDVDLTVAPRTRLAVVGETGSGKTTFAKLLTRLMDPTAGAILLNGVGVDRIAFTELRRRVVMVPQDGFLFDTSIAENVRQGRAGATDADVVAAFDDLGLGDWLRTLPDGVATRVGERGEQLSVGERQLVALARAAVADPALLVLDEATSAVDPATEARIARALDRLTADRTTVTIAHRLSTAEAADQILVFADGAVVQRGTHTGLAASDGPYARLYASWTAHRRHAGGISSPSGG